MSDQPTPQVTNYTGQPARTPAPRRKKRRGRLTNQQVNEIVGRYLAGERVTDLALEYQISHRAIHSHLKKRGAVDVVRGTKTSDPQAPPVVIEGRETSYRESLNWALEAAGRFLRTHASPETCPNDSTWYLYCQACESPKDFLSHIHQVEGRATDDGGKEISQEARRSIAEIEAILESFSGEEYDDAT